MIFIDNQKYSYLHTIDWDKIVMVAIHKKEKIHHIRLLVGLLYFALCCAGVIQEGKCKM